MLGVRFPPPEPSSGERNSKGQESQPFKLVSAGTQSAAPTKIGRRGATGPAHPALTRRVGGSSPLGGTRIMKKPVKFRDLGTWLGPLKVLLPKDMKVYDIHTGKEVGVASSTGRATDS